MDHPEPVVAPHGSWASPIGIDDVIAGGGQMSSLQADEADLLWLESRPDQDGRQAIMRLHNGVVNELTPRHANVRSRVDEYGGGAFHASGGVIVYCDESDHTLKLRAPNGTVRTLTNGDPLVRYGDVRVYPGVPVVLAVREDHRVPGEPETTIVALEWPTADDRPVAENVLRRGASFYANPELGPGLRLAWLQWDHPAMPWDCATLHVGRLHRGGGLAVRDAVQIAGRRGFGPDGAAAHHPRWAPDGSLLFTADPDGFFRLHSWRDDRDDPVRPLHSDAHDFDLPMFTLGNHAFAALDEARVLTWYFSEGLCHLAVVSTRGEPTRRMAGVSSVDSVCVALGEGYALVDRPVGPRALVRVCPDGTLDTLRTLAGLPDRDVTSVARSLMFTGRHGPVQAWYYPPANARFAAPRATRPPLLVQVHGGPTAIATNAYYPTYQFWTSRGFAVLDVNYSGSAGFGRAWRDRLRGMWGVADVDDCIDATEAAVDAGLADPGRVVIVGGSAGGYTALRAVTTSDRFAAAISRYGIADLKALVGGHKFESHYMDSLVGPWPEDERVYRDRSPINNLDKLASPILLLQGTDDPVVPPDQASALADAARRRGLPVALVMFEGEGHGFHTAAARSRTLEAQLSFLSQLFGFTPADDIPRLPIDNLPGR